VLSAIRIDAVLGRRPLPGGRNLIQAWIHGSTMRNYVYEFGMMQRQTGQICRAGRIRHGAADSILINGPHLRVTTRLGYVAMDTTRNVGCPYPIRTKAGRARSR
jgi:hypothetical protein